MYSECYTEQPTNTPRRKPKKKLCVSHAEYEAIRKTGRKTICVSRSEDEAIQSNIRSGDHDEAARIIIEAVDGRNEI